MAYYNQDINSIFKTLNSNSGGLSSQKAQDLLLKYGENKLDKQKKQSFLKKLLLQFKNIMIIILIISAIISVAHAIIENSYENLFEAVLIFVIVLINAIVGVIQEEKAENALDALESSAEPYATVVRDGISQKIKVHELVVGDIVLLKAGNYVPADIRIIECNNFKCDESSMTGESHSVLKSSNIIHKNNLTIADQENMCFFGTTVTSGSATGIVVETGKNTELGKIAKELSVQIKEKTPLEKSIDKIGKVITIAILVIVFIVFLVQVLLSKTTSVIDALLTAVALAVAAIPESLPTVITVIMALGVQKLARQNAIIRKLSAVETLGSCNVICSDKTGTLTKNQMSVSHVYSNLELFDSSNFDFSLNDKLSNVSALCNNAIIDKSNKVTADATETAIINFLNKQKINVLDIKSLNKKIYESEFNSTTKMMSIALKKDNNTTLYVKGAIDYLIDKCDSVFINGNIKPLSPEIKHKILSANERVGLDGERVIAFAIKENASNFKEENLTFVGFMGIIDPPRPEAKKAIKECKTAGLKPIMITGDHPTTAFAIAKKLKIASTKKEVLTGQEISTLSEKELSKIINNYSVFARVTPKDKLLIVNALKLSGKIVAMTGDGINDAPSIKSASIGAAMGITGTDVTKEVADIILTDDNFATLVVAIKEGRTIYQNIAKTVLFLISTNLVEVLGIFITSLILPGSIFLLPTQILFINLVTDSLPAFALGVEPAERNIMQKPPRNPNKSLLSGNIGTSIIYQGFVQTLIVLVMFVFAKNYFGNEVASTMSFLTICLMQIIHAVNCKTERSIFRTNIFKNKFFNFSFIFLIGLILAVYFVPVLSGLFGLTVLTGLEWIIIIATSFSIIPLVEIGKIFIK